MSAFGRFLFGIQRRIVRVLGERNGAMKHFPTLPDGIVFESPQYSFRGLVFRCHTWLHTVMLLREMNYKAQGLHATVRRITAFKSRF